MCVIPKQTCDAFSYLRQSCAAQQRGRGTLVASSSENFSDQTDVDCVCVAARHNLDVIVQVDDDKQGIRVEEFVQSACRPAEFVVVIGRTRDRE